MESPSDAQGSRSLFESHPRGFEQNRYVYPVLSRRCGGVSIGVNLSPEKLCNFDCIYCQVDRQAGGAQPPGPGPIELDRLVEELERTIELVNSGEIYRQARFRHAPKRLRRLNDIAISGDGEPTMCAEFEAVVAACAEVRRRCGQADLKLILISNASLFHQDRVRRALEVLEANGGEIWAKLDVGTEAYYRQVARTNVPFQQILENIADAARVRPIVIQTLRLRIHGEAAPPAEQEAYCQRLAEIIARGGRIKLVQIYTLARPPAESWVSPLSDAELDALAELVRQRTGLPVQSFSAAKT